MCCPEHSVIFFSSLLLLFSFWFWVPTLFWNDLKPSEKLIQKSKYLPCTLHLHCWPFAFFPMPALSCLPPPSSPVSFPGWPWCLLLCLFYPYCFLSYFGATTHVPLHAWVHFLKAKASITTIWGPRPEQYYWKTASQLQHVFKFCQFPQNCPSNKFVFSFPRTQPWTTHYTQLLYDSGLL